MSKQRFHLNDKGPAICRAKSDESCPLGAKTGNFTHYDSMAEAQKAFEAQLETETGGSLSRKVKKVKVHAIDANPFSLVEDPPRVESGTILKANDGSLVIISENMTYSEFGGYMIGNLSNEASVAKRLHELDPFKEYQEGSCDSVSFALLESNPDIVAVDELVNENGDMWHSIARHKGGYYIDSLGKWDEQDLFDYWETIGEREDEGEFTWRRNVQDLGVTPNFRPKDDLKPLVDYLNGLTNILS